MQRRELDRNAGVLADIRVGAGLRNGGDRAGIAQVVAFGIRLGAGGLAQHVVAVGKALLLHPRRAGHGRGDGFAQNELAAHFLHRAGDGGADHRLTQTFDRGAQMLRGAFGFVVEHLARQHQRPSRGIDQRRGRMPQMFGPVRRGDLVLDQRIHRVGVRHAQQRLGQTHQGDALVGAQPVFGKKHLHQTRRGFRPDVAHQPRG